MAARTSMASLITRVRLMVGDTGTAVFTDEQVQSFLDQHRIDVRYGEMVGEETRASGGAVTYLTFWDADRLAFWESDAAITDHAYNTLTATTYEYELGRFTFSTDQTANCPLHLTGKTYDVNAAAADLLDAWASLVAIQFDYADAAVTDSWQKKQAQLIKMADRYRSMSRPGHVALVRLDMGDMRVDY